MELKDVTSDFTNACVDAVPRWCSEGIKIALVGEVPASVLPAQRAVFMEGSRML